MTHSVISKSYLQKVKQSLDKFLVSATLIFISGFAIAQDNFTIKMSVKAEGLPPEYAAYAEQDVIIYIKGDKIKSEKNGMMGSSVTLYDGKKMTSLMENMGTKFGYTATKEELETTGKSDKSEKPKIEYTTEKKMIAGYECAKVVVTSIGKDKKESTTILWVTDKIRYNHAEYFKAAARGMSDLSELKGYALGMEMQQNAQGGMEIKIIMNSTEITTTALNDSVFNVSSDGYTMMTYKEMLDKQKTMMGGGK
ncbi:hypothetical protein [Aurantibacillus circumpalustris]|uniref:hypothetical protein n=1 Tax=Aurantibacillus circumpalustris TaxID=3036359 RepID=UPI00295C3A57|nr:hypothetical protein [Aurantibacillus circumpalustris]